MAIEHAMFKFEDLKVNSHDDKQTDRMTTKLLSPRPRIKCGETNNHDNIIGGVGISGDFSTAPAINSYNDYLILSHWGKREHHLIISIFVTCRDSYRISFRGGESDYAR